MLVQQRGRWANIKNMNIYLLELSATTLLSRLSFEARENVCDLHGQSSHLLQHGGKLARAGFPPDPWPDLFKKEQS